MTEITCQDREYLCSCVPTNTSKYSVEVLEAGTHAKYPYGFGILEARRTCMRAMSFFFMKCGKMEIEGRKNAEEEEAFICVARR